MAEVGIATTVTALLLLLGTPMLTSLWESFHKGPELRVSSKLLIIAVIGVVTVLFAQKTLPPRYVPGPVPPFSFA